MERMDKNTCYFNSNKVTLARRTMGETMIEIGSLVRHKRFGDIGIITHIYETRITFVVLADGKPWRTYRNAVEVL